MGTRKKDGLDKALTIEEFALLAGFDQDDLEDMFGGNARLVPVRPGGGGPAAEDEDDDGLWLLGA